MQQKDVYVDKSFEPRGRKATGRIGPLSLIHISCDDVDNPVDNPSTDGETAYVVAATVGEASYLVAVSSLEMCIRDRISVVPRCIFRSFPEVCLGISVF